MGWGGKLFSSGMICNGFLKEDTWRDFPRKTRIKDLIGINFLQVRELLGHLRHRFKSPTFHRCVLADSLQQRDEGEADERTMCKSAKNPNSDIVPACGDLTASQEVTASSLSSPEQMP